MHRGWWRRSEETVELEHGRPMEKGCCDRFGLSIYPPPGRLLQPPMLDLRMTLPRVVGLLGFEKEVVGSGSKMEEKHG